MQMRMRGGEGMGKKSVAKRSSKLMRFQDSLTHGPWWNGLQPRAVESSSRDSDVPDTLCRNLRHKLRPLCQDTQERT